MVRPLSPSYCSLNKTEFDGTPSICHFMTQVHVVIKHKNAYFRKKKKKSLEHHLYCEIPLSIVRGKTETAVVNS